MKLQRLLPKKSWLNVQRAWLALFGIWTLLLSGVFADFVGTPGLVQWRKLEELYQLKKSEQERLEYELARVQKEIVDLEKDPEAQRREIRRLLGYVAPDEVIFEFPETVTAQH